MSLGPAWRLHPYITPATVSHCATRQTVSNGWLKPVGLAVTVASSASALAKPSFSAKPSSSKPSPSALPLVLIDSDVPSDVEGGVRDACSAIGCTSVRVVNRTRAEVAELLSAASVAIDWCMVGSERMPIEAVLCGAVLLTNDCMGGSDRMDFPLPPRNVLPAPSGLSGLQNALSRILSNMERERRGYDRMRRVYRTVRTAKGLREDAWAFLGAHRRGGRAHYKVLYARRTDEASDAGR